MRRCATEYGQSYLVDWTSAESWEDGVQVAAFAMLNGLQDILSEELKESWPIDRTRGRSYMAPPQVEVRGDVLHLWYGEPGQSVLEIGAIPVGPLKG